MSATWWSAGIAAGVLANAAVGGTYLAFSAFVMRGLQSLPSQTALAAMQRVNREAPRPGLLVPMLGGAALCVVLSGWAVARRIGGAPIPAEGWVLAGSLACLGSLAVTVGYHVPRNDRLALIDPYGADAPAAWLAYAPAWTRWNHVRCASALGGAALLAVALAG